MGISDLRAAPKGESAKKLFAAEGTIIVRLARFLISDTSALCIPPKRPRNFLDITKYASWGFSLYVIIQLLPRLLAAP